MLAAVRGHRGLVSYLHEYGADINIQNNVRVLVWGHGFITASEATVARATYHPPTL